MDSDSDLPLLRKTPCQFKAFGIPYEVRVASAHRTPDVVSEYVKEAENRGCAVFIWSCQDSQLTLAGAIPARTTRPVIGIPCDGRSLYLALMLHIQL